MQERLKKDVQQKATDVQYKLNRAKARITQFQGRLSCVQAGVHHTLGPELRLRLGIERIRDQLIETLQFYQHDYLKVAFSSLKPRRQALAVNLAGPFIELLPALLTA